MILLRVQVSVKVYAAVSVPLKKKIDSGSLKAHQGFKFGFVVVRKKFTGSGFGLSKKIHMKIFISKIL